jgi:hypothetical protein
MIGPTSLSTALDEPRRSKILTSRPQIRYRELLVTSWQLRENRADTDRPALPTPRAADRSIEQLELFPAA